MIEGKDDIIKYVEEKIEEHIKENSNEQVEISLEKLNTHIHYKFTIDELFEIINENYSIQSNYLRSIVINIKPEKEIENNMREVKSDGCCVIC